MDFTDQQLKPCRCGYQVSGEKETVFPDFMTIMLFGAIGTAMSFTFISFGAKHLIEMLNIGSLSRISSSFMCPSGINDFPMTNTTHIKEGLSVLAKYRRPLLVHAEIEQEPKELKEEVDDARSYSTYLRTRPASWWNDGEASKNVRKVPGGIAGRPSLTGVKSLPVRPGMFLETLLIQSWPGPWSRSA